ncbi:hypothetical protein KEJ15_05210 [Candidatus Bathyarchaeota archaeon]|nr:hypothetical protein [Candidatus Bathyarchaeota archaeon]
MRYIEVGAFISSLVFISSFFTIWSIDSSWHLVAILEENPLHYIDYVRNTLIFSIFPQALGLVFFTVGYKKQSIRSTRNLHKWALAIMGGVFLSWGALLLFLLYNAYDHSTAAASYLGVQGIGNLILTIYVIAWLACALWMVTGILLAYFSIVKDRGFGQNVTSS